MPIYNYSLLSVIIHSYFIIESLHRVRKPVLLAKGELQLSGAKNFCRAGLKRGMFGGVDSRFAFIYEHLHRVRAASRIVSKN